MSLTTRNDIFANVGKGQGYSLTCRIANHGTATTAGTSTSGFYQVELFLNQIGTTQPGTLVGLPFANSPSSPLLHMFSHMGVNNANYRSLYLARIYVIGTVDFSATGNKFTHDAATFPLLRTVMGQASQPIPLLPMLYITTASTATAPAFILKNSAPSAGYVNQDGTNVTGTLTFTFPSATTNVASGFFIPLEDGDTGIRDIIDVNVTTAGSSSPAGTIFGVELLAPLAAAPPISGSMSNSDTLFRGLSPTDMAPAVATSGTVTSYLTVLGFSGNANGLAGDMFTMAVTNA